MIIPRRPFEQCPVTGQWNEVELATARLQVPVQMSGMDVVIRRPFLHGFRILRDGKFQQPRLIPDFNWFDKRAGREITMPHGTYALAPDFRTDGIGNTKFEN